MSFRKNIKGYLFAHMTAEDYGRLYYSVSTDGLHWQMINRGKRILGDEYYGHPDICQGHDGSFYMMGNIKTEQKRDITIWQTKDLISWKFFLSFLPDVSGIIDHAEINRGAPKIFFDKIKRQYIITWHTANEKRTKTEPEKYWGSQRTCYVISEDLQVFSTPQRLFPFDFATIDVIIRRQGEYLYAFLKDETFPSYDWPTGKSIRICKAKSITGPWSIPGNRITPNFREAPAIIPKPDETGWYLYYEQYPGIQYGLSTATDFDNSWYDLYINHYSIPAGARHGCMLPLTSELYNGIIRAYS